MTRVKRGRGFTLIELVVTVTILSVLALGALPLAELTIKRGKERELREALRQIRGAIDDYKTASVGGTVARAADASGYPASLNLLVDGVIDQRDPNKRRKIYFLRRLPRDPMAEDAAVAPADTWGLRSYESPPENPQAGKDVFDIHSRSGGVGINGVPYREW